MYYYIVDANKVNQRDFERVQANLYSSISEYHISGEIVRVTGIRTIRQLVETAFFHQAKTIVAVGTDETLDEIVNVAGDRDITLGFIPLVQTDLSYVLGIPDIAQACKFLAVRRVEEIDLGLINGKQFLSKLEFGLDVKQKTGFDFFGLNFAKKLAKTPTLETRFRVDNNYQASSEIWSGLILNTRGATSSKEIGNPSDGVLDLLLLPKVSQSSAFTHKNQILKGEFEKIPNASVIHFQKLEMIAPLNMRIRLGSQELTEVPATISIKPKALKIIVGRNRTF